MSLPEKLTYQPSGNTFELYAPDAPDETAGLGEVDDEAVAREICERWNAWTDLDHALKSRSVVDKVETEPLLAELEKFGFFAERR